VTPSKVLKLLEGEALLTVEQRFALADSWPVAGPVVDGREVGDEIPNQSSIGSSISEYEIQRGVREVPMSAFGFNGTHYSVQGHDRIQNLARQILASKFVTPLIVAIDAEGPYVVEGMHRGNALHVVGAASFPALVVVDTESDPEP